MYVNKKTYHFFESQAALKALAVYKTSSSPSRDSEGPDAAMPLKRPL